MEHILSILRSIQKHEKKRASDFNLDHQAFGKYVKCIKNNKFADNIYIRESENIFVMTSIEDANLTHKGLELLEDEEKRLSFKCECL